ncbi:MAG TPA: TetR family transcriptional regulator [Casimicrobiaceae bacterium]|nr:TetR family transcriptional regulator [Casimicrobiaceae bacterium]
MARKTKTEAAITREQLLDAAERVFREQGVTRTSLAEVAAAAGVTRGAVYWHFRDKADLFEAMCERATLPLDALLSESASGPCSDPMAALRELSIAVLNTLAGDPRAQAVFEVIFHKTELTGELASVAGEREQERCQCLANVERLLQQAVAVGQLPEDTDPGLAARFLHACIAGLMREWVLDKTAYDLAARAPAFVDAIIGGLVAHSPRRAERVLPRVRPRAVSPA